MRVDGQLQVHEYRRGPGGTPLVLLHGFPLDRRMWDDVVDLLPGERTVLAVELPGFGASPRGEDVAEALGLDEEPALETAAAGVIEVLRARGLDRVVLAGLSMGGYVAMAVLEVAPELVAGLALLDTKSTADPPDAAANRHRIADAVEDEHRIDQVLGMRTGLLGESNRLARPDLAARLETWIRDQGPDAIAWAQRAMAARPDRTAALQGFAGHSVVVVGEEDELAPVEAARAMVEALSALGTSELVVVPRAGHMTTVEQPEAVAAALTGLVLRSEQDRPRSADES